MSRKEQRKFVLKHLPRFFHGQELLKKRRWLLDLWEFLDEQEELLRSLGVDIESH